ncbi:tRNA (guanosine(37)-N1)-methyltransferase TrmD [Stieleria varia]|uniref:tRNA (guanine-N(1)-)-methyltransferase n=1 Tax=Stieleria varia TaxID=2528005 RepID=A0A5C6ANV6_9BACT|nr:tRNA (guanosine(37)-N1)-methyltransferase TrmD [Stieleria varia]TWU00786.1 tRNA (guanine-N(1)-)-methyltransferase [Stieleria varia]
MRFDVVTLFPAIFDGYLTQSLLEKAIQRGLVDIQRHDLRDWAQDTPHRKVDDRPFGGGPGMLLQVDVTVRCVNAVDELSLTPARRILLTPQGKRFDQRMAEDLATSDRVMLLCGRYEGFDQRVTDILEPEEVSIGDFVLNGGEVAAMVIIDSVVRLLPGVLGDENSSVQDSFSRGNRLLEYPQYTRPREFQGHCVPDVLLGGDHGAIAAWREKQSRIRTEQRRSDLLDGRSDQND